MKKAAVIPVVVIAVLALSAISHAADLQAGWYARVESVTVLYDYPGSPEYGASAFFYQTPPGQYGPFLVTGGNPSRDYRRYVSVPLAFRDAQPQQSLTMPLYIGISQGTHLTRIGMSWETDYDPDIMNLQLWHTTQAGVPTLLWTQSVGGYQWGGYIWGYDTLLDGYYSVRIAIVPEPSTLLLLAVGLLSVAWRRKR